MARRKKRGRTGGLVDGSVASLDAGGPPVSKRRCFPSSTIPAPVSSGPNSSPHVDPTPAGTIPADKTLDAATPDTAPLSYAKSWSAYFSEVGLIKLGIRLFTPWNSDGRKSLRRNFSRLMPIEYIAESFNLNDQMRASKKSQPDEANLSDFEDKNEPTLTLIEDNSCIIRDNSVGAEPLVLKIGHMPVGVNQSTPAVHETLTTSLLSSTLSYISNCNSSSIVQDLVRHPASQSNPNHQKKIRKGGPIPRPPNSGSCHRIHVQHCARNDNEINNIQLFRGPAGTWDSRVASGGLHDFLKRIYPLTQLLEVVFKVFLSQCWEKYDKVRGRMPDESGGEYFGLWRSRAIVIDSMTNVHRDLKDVCYGWCAIVPLGEFQGGDICLPGLGYRIKLPVGSILFLRSHIIPHYVGYWSGHRFSIVHFSHQSTFDYYTQETGERLHDYEGMPGWWRSSRLPEGRLNCSVEY